MILGLDISTSSTGICVINENKLEYINYFCPDGFDVFSKTDSINVHIDKVMQQYPIKQVYVEEPLIRMGGSFKTSADTLKLLIRFNFAICFHIYEIHKLKPIYVPFSSARRILNLKKVDIEDDSLVKLNENKSVHLDKILGCQYVINTMSEFKNKLFISQNLYSKGKNKGLPKDCVFDCSDSVVIALAGATYVREIANT